MGRRIHDEKVLERMYVIDSQDDIDEDSLEEMDILDDARVTHTHTKDIINKCIR